LRTGEGSILSGYEIRLLFGLIGLCCLAFSEPDLRGQTNAPIGVPKDAMSGHSHASGPISTHLSITVSGKATTLTMADLQPLPQTMVTAHDGHSNSD
jgi:hypothetical protein